MVRPFARKPGVTMSPLDNRLVAIVEKYYPAHTELYVTAGTNGTHAAHSYHYSGQAIDLGSYDDTRESRAKNQADMDKAALWIYDNFWDLSLELIHCAPSLPQMTYAKDQRKVGPYGPASAHVNHIHWATSIVLMGRIETRAYQRFGPHPAPVPTHPATHPFPLPAGHFYGLDDRTHWSHSGAVANDQAAIRQIQAKLGIITDGRFGGDTYRHVRSYQAAHGLRQDGKVGPATWAHLFA